MWFDIRSIFSSLSYGILDHKILIASVFVISFSSDHVLSANKIPKPDYSSLNPVIYTKNRDLYNFTYSVLILHSDASGFPLGARNEVANIMILIGDDAISDQNRINVDKFPELTRSEADFLRKLDTTSSSCNLHFAGDPLVSVLTVDTEAISSEELSRNCVVIAVGRILGLDKTTTTLHPNWTEILYKNLQFFGRKKER